MNPIEHQNYEIIVTSRISSQPLFRKIIQIPVFWDYDYQEWSFTPEAYQIIDTARTELRKEAGYGLTDYLLPVEFSC